MTDRAETVLTEAFSDAEVDCTWTPEGHAQHALAALKAARIAVVNLPDPSEWIDGKPQWNDYPFVRLTPGADDEIALGASCEHLYGINRHEARNVAADLLAAADATDAAEAESRSTAPKCSSCGRPRTVRDAYDYNPLQVITGQPLGWYSGDDGEMCPECMTRTVGGQQ